MALAPFALAAPPPPAQVCGPKENATKLDDGDVPNGFFDNVYTYGECCAKCTARSDCGAIVYLQSHFQCWLKANSGWTKVIRTDYDWVSSVRQWPPPPPSPPRFCGVPQYGITLPNADIPNGLVTNVATQSGCCDLCFNRSDCGAYTFLQERFECYMKYSSGWNNVTRDYAVSSVLRLGAAPGNAGACAFACSCSAVLVMLPCQTAPRPLG